MSVRAAEARGRYHDILDAAERVIARQGYNGAQVSRIAAEAGVAGGTVYLYFANKKDLIISLFRERFGLFIEEVDRRTRAARTAAEALQGIVAVHLGALAARPDMAVVTQVEMRQSDPDIQRGIQDAISPYLQRIEEVLRRGREDGSFAPGLDVRLGKRLVFGTLDQCVTAWVMSGRRYDLASLAPDVARLLTHGLAGSGEAGGGMHAARGKEGERQ